MKKELEQLKKSTLIFDIETSSQYPDGELIDISTNFEDYVKFAKVKWIGMYSYLHDEYVLKEIQGNEDLIKNYIGQHKVLVGFNNEEFDTPIMYNNDLMVQDKYFKQVDCMVVLGSSTAYKQDGLPFKNRGELMGYKFKRNSLKEIAKSMELETQKGDIDYMIFLKNSWTDEETVEIKKYLKSDIKVTKEMFEKLWEFWMPFTNFISEKNVMNLSWIRSSIASLRYKGDCHTLGVEETYGEKTDKPKEKMGGNVIEPKYEEARNVWYIDFGSLYPWIRNMFCIDNEVEADKLLNLKNMFHGNNIFQVKGYYDISKESPIAIQSKKNLIKRADMKINDPTNELIYAIKIYENAGYGALRSEIFEQIHTPNAGWDICWLGQQIQKLTEDMMVEFGFQIIAGDTDSLFMIGDKEYEEKYVKECLEKILNKIKANVPFPTEHFKIDIENYILYIMWPFSEQPVVGPDGKNLKNEKGRLIKKLKGLKKNYVCLYYKEKELILKIVGLPIIKDNSTKLGPKILEDTIKPLILKSRQAKFSKEKIDNILKEWLSKPDSIKDLAREFKVKPAKTYKKESQIQAQISTGYFGGQGGVISLIKNKKVGRAGKTARYCTFEEAQQNNLEMSDLDLTKLNNELAPFIEN